MLLLLAAACSGPGEPVDPEMPEPQGWIAEVVHEPEAFAGLIEREGREGWVALHAHRYAEAWATFAPDTTGRARAAGQLAALHGDLSRLSGLVHDQLFREWAERSGLPESSAAPVVAALAARCTGIGDPSRWETAAAPGAEVLTGPEEAWWAVELPESHPWAPRVAMHRAAMEGDPAALTSAPVLSEGADGFTRTFHDPCVHSTLAAVWEARRTELPAEALGARLFSPWLTPRDVERPSTLGLPPLEGPDEVQPARERVQALDHLLSAWERALTSQAGPDGLALLTDLGLTPRFRQERLVLLAHEALQENRAQQARILLQLARDAAAREVGPRNGPRLFALLAEAELRTGRVREALDALQILAQAHPEVVGLREVAGDLSVLRGLDRRGVSREE